MIIHALHRDKADVNGFGERIERIVLIHAPYTVRDSHPLTGEGRGWGVSIHDLNEERCYVSCSEE